MAGKDEQCRQHQSSPIHEPEDNGGGSNLAVTSPTRLPAKRSRPASTPPDDDDASLDFNTLSGAEGSQSPSDDDDDDEDEDDIDEDNEDTDLRALQRHATCGNAPRTEQSRFRSRYGDMDPERALGEYLVSVYAL